MDPPGYKLATNIIANRMCHFCAHELDVKGWATCSKYGCRVLLNSVCDSFEPIGARERALPTPAQEYRLDGPWMKYPPRVTPARDRNQRHPSLRTKSAPP